MSDFLLQLSNRIAELELQVQELKVGQIQQTLFFRSELGLLERRFVSRLNRLRNEIIQQDLQDN